jgi:hypothetical protein
MMDSLGIALLVGGTAFIMSGLIFLVPIERRCSSPQEMFDDVAPPQQTLEDSQDPTQYYLRALRNKQEKN